MAGYIGTQAVSVNTTSATISDDLTVGDDATIAGTALVTGVLTTTAATVHNGGITLPDGNRAIFGADTDMQLFHNGSSGTIANSTGSLVVRTDAFRVLNDANSEQILHGDADGAVTAYFNNAVKLATTNTGVTVTGEMAATTMDLSSNAVIDGSVTIGVAGQTTYALQSKVKAVYLSSTDSSYANITIRKEAATSTDYLQVRDNGNNLISKMTSGGELTVGNGLILTDGNITVASGHGINFAAQTATSATDAGATNELLSHYEEGNWTPVMFSGSSTTQPTAYASQQGRYVRVGSILHYQGRLKINGLGSVSGAPRIGGLPFTVINDGAYPATTIGWANGLNITASETITGTPGPNTTAIELRIWNSAAGVSDMTAAEFSDDGDIIFSGTFEVV
jgi:hypothetical protein